MKTFLLAATTVSLLSSAALAQMAPQAFVEKSASGSAFEIQSSQMILDAGGADADVKEFAEDMITDHTKATADLKTAASAAGLTVPEALAPKQKTMLEQLEASDDKTELYIQQQVSAHNEAVVLHESYAADGEDANLKSFAEAQRPILREHLGHVEGLNSSDAGMASGMDMPADSATGTVASDTGESGMATGSTSADEAPMETSPSSATTGPVTSGTVTTGGSGTGSGTTGSSGTIDAGEGNSGGVSPQQ